MNTQKRIVFTVEFTCVLSYARPKRRKIQTPRSWVCQLILASTSLDAAECPDGATALRLTQNSYGSVQVTLRQFYFNSGRDFGGLARGWRGLPEMDAGREGWKWFRAGELGRVRSGSCGIREDFGENI